MLPPHSCDAHLHVFGPPARYPGAPSRQYQPRERTFAEYLALAQGLGIERAVLVQPSAYGSDNRALLDTLRAYPAITRGVVVIDPAIAEDQLREMHALGVRGVRLNLMNPRVRSADEARATIDPVVARIASHGWHLQIYADPDVVAPIASLLRSLDVPVVLDHCAGGRARAGVNDRHFTALVELYASGGCWVKVSGADIVSEQGTNDGPVGDDELAAAAPFVRAFAQAGSSRLVWGTDWPHLFHFHGASGDAAPDTIFRQVDERALVRLLQSCVTPDDCRRILVENPRKLYGFE